MNFRDNLTKVIFHRADTINYDETATIYPRVRSLENAPNCYSLSGASHSLAKTSRKPGLSSI